MEVDINAQYRKEHPIKPKIEKKSTEEKIEYAPEIHLDVPLINQLDIPKVYNGCEVTSLAMLLNYLGISVSKSELAEAIPKEPYLYYSGLYGDPNEGFVGNIYGGSGGKGYFVYHGPIVDLAQEYIPKSLEVEDLTGCDFPTILKSLSDGHPVWVITTTTFSETTDTATWETENGEVLISMKEHSVLLTGYDEDSVYLNDPYGNKHYKTDMENFSASWQQLGSQAVIIQEKQK